MTGHRAFAELSRTFSRARKTRVANKAAALETELAKAVATKTRPPKGGNPRRKP